MSITIKPRVRAELGASAAMIPPAARGGVRGPHGGHPRGRTWLPVLALTLAVLAGLAGTFPAQARAATPGLGEVGQFWAVNWSDPNAPARVTGTVRHVGEHCVIYVQSDRTVGEVALRDLADAFDGVIYPTLTGVLGAEPNPGIDGDPKIHILVYPFSDPQYVGYFLPADINPALGGVSNRQELISLDLVRVLYEPQQAAATAAHEFAHLISYHRDFMLDPAPSREATWVDEGIAMYAELLCGLGGPGTEVASFAADPGKNLTRWDGTMADYGASLAFVGYLAEGYGQGILPRLVEETADGAAGVDAALAGAGHATSFASVYGDWLVANYLDGRLEEASPPYGYAGIDIAAAAAELPGPFPRIGSGLAPNYGCTYLELPLGDLLSVVRVVIDGEDGSPLHAALVSWEPSAPGVVEVLPVPMAPGYTGGSVASSPGFSRHVLALWGAGAEGAAAHYSYRYSVAFPAQHEQQFLDVGADHTFFTYIESLLSQGAVSGKEAPAGSGLWYFSPEEPLLRAQFSKMIVEGLGLHTPEVDLSLNPTFADVPPTGPNGRPLTYPYDYVEEAYASGIVNGVGDGSFHPWDGITRIQLVRMILRGAAAAGQPLPRYTGNQAFFADVSPANPLYGDVMTAWAAGIISGSVGTDGRAYFAPWDTANRGQVSKMLAQLLAVLAAGS